MEDAGKAKIKAIFLDGSVCDVTTDKNSPGVAVVRLGGDVEARFTAMDGKPLVVVSGCPVFEKMYRWLVAQKAKKEEVLRALEDEWNKDFTGELVIQALNEFGWGLRENAVRVVFAGFLILQYGTESAEAGRACEWLNWVLRNDLELTGESAKMANVLLTL